MHARAREGVVGAESSASSTQGSHPDHSPTDHSLVALHDFWASLSGKLIPSTKDLEAMRKALELPGATLTLVMDFVKGAYRRAKDNGDPPTSFRYFLPGLERELQRRKLMAEPVKQTPPDEVDPNDIWDPRSPNFMKVS